MLLLYLLGQMRVDEHVGLNHGTGVPGDLLRRTNRDVTVLVVVPVQGPPPALAPKMPVILQSPLPPPSPL